MDTGKEFDDHVGGPFLINDICVRAMRIASRFGVLVLMWCFPLDNAHRELQRLPTNI